MRYDTLCPIDIERTITYTTRSIMTVSLRCGQYNERELKQFRQRGDNNHKCIHNLIHSYSVCLDYDTITSIQHGSMMRKDWVEKYKGKWKRCGSQVSTTHLVFFFLFFFLSFFSFLTFILRGDET